MNEITSTDLETRVAELAQAVDATQRIAYDLAAENPKSEHLQEVWSNLDAAHTLVYRYLRLLRERGVSKQ